MLLLILSIAIRCIKSLRSQPLNCHLTTTGKLITHTHTHVPLSLSSITWCQLKCGDVLWLGS